MGRRHAYLALLCTFSALAGMVDSPARAQQAQTDCRETASGTVHCTTSADQDHRSKNPDFCAEGGLFAGCMPGEIKAAKERIALRKRVGQLLAKGQCEDAVKTALAEGNLDLAREAKDLCMRPAPQ